jgi:hypothetical protein
MVTHIHCNNTNMTWLTNSDPRYHLHGQDDYLTGMNIGDFIERLLTADNLNFIGISQVLSGGGL